MGGVQQQQVPQYQTGYGAAQTAPPISQTNYPTPQSGYNNPAPAQSTGYSTTGSTGYSTTGSTGYSATGYQPQHAPHYPPPPVPPTQTSAYYGGSSQQYQQALPNPVFPAANTMQTSTTGYQVPLPTQPVEHQTKQVTIPHEVSKYFLKKLYTSFFILYM